MERYPELTLSPCPLGFCTLLMDPAQVEAERQGSPLVQSIQEAIQRRGEESRKRVDSGETKGKYQLDIHHFIYSLK